MAQQEQHLFLHPGHTKAIRALQRLARMPKLEVMQPIHVAIFAVIVIFLGALASFWLKEETAPPPVATYEAPKEEIKVDASSLKPKLLVKNAYTKPIGEQDFEVYYTLVNASQAPLDEVTRVTIFPYRHATDSYKDYEGMVDLGDSGWRVSQTDLVKPLKPGEQVERKVKLNYQPRYTPLKALSATTHFAIQGHPQE